MTWPWGGCPSRAPLTVAGLHGPKYAKAQREAEGRHQSCADLAGLVSSCVTLGKSPHLSEPPFSHSVQSK